MRGAIYSRYVFLAYSPQWSMFFGVLIKETGSKLIIPLKSSRNTAVASNQSNVYLYAMHWYLMLSLESLFRRLPWLTAVVSSSILNSVWWVNKNFQWPNTLSGKMWVSAHSVHLHLVLYFGLTLLTNYIPTSFITKTQQNCTFCNQAAQKFTKLS